MSAPHIAGKQNELLEDPFSEDVELILSVANARTNADNLTDAICLYMFAAEIDPLNYQVLQGLTNCLLMLRLYDQAIPFATLMIDVQPRNPIGYYFSGLACFSSGHHQEAIEDFEIVRHLKDEVKDPEILSKSEILLARMKNASSVSA